ncbi:hypothetical protein GO988_23495 [Hymenobacter sp. HMF4947]|uniref:Uncharacterized protein n=1 Tax=Hymenobacter ginkgonis TaxID=2682976 RepID=A0A7K1TLL0_9BACT|nr:hypothetical protein [Hymenobacter ginkgonis]MVN79308.1 hypothetical protein [Hymenobacter ginkgonis]
MNTVLNPTAAEIDFWSDKVESKALFPELVRRLIVATTPHLLRIDFPSGDSIYEAGWDGITLNSVGNSFVPEGSTGWELGTTGDKVSKARKDYTERTKKPRELTPSTTTFILVSSRNWSATSKRQFVQEKQAEGHWKAVRVYDAKDLEVWLTAAPAVQYWFSRLIGKRPTGVTDIDSYWADWTAQTHPTVLPFSLLVLGRQKETAEVHTWLKGEDGILSLRADSQSEAVAFFIATIQELPDHERATYYSRCLVVLNPEAWHELVSSFTSLLIVPLFDDRSMVSGALRQGHRIIVPLDQTEVNWKNKAVELPRLPLLEVTEALQNQGFLHEKAYILAGIARRSFAAFRRALAEHSAISQPAWAHTEHPSILIAALLAGSWDEQRERDTEAVAQVANLPYAEVKAQLMRWRVVADPPVRLVGHVWYIVDVADVWSLVSSNVTKEQLDRFRQVVVSVLGSIPPRYDLPAEEWYRADMLGKKSPYSGTLRKSLATTLAYLGAINEPLLETDTTTGDLAVRLVMQLLQAANTDWRIWSALSHNLRLLAEAAPSTFLQAVSAGLSGDEPPVLKLFEERQDLLNTSSDHPGLLWALEVLAWSPSYLLPSTLLLAKLVRLAPHGKLNNRPINSLREIFLLWYPHTTATLDQRLQILDELQRQEPEVASHLLTYLTPKARSISTGTATPRWRDWVTARNVTRREVYEATLDIQARLLREAKQDVARWVSIIEDLPELPYDQQELVVQQLYELSREITADAERMRLRDSIRELVSSHRSFHDTDWAMPPVTVNRLAEVMEEFEPVNVILKYAWLFDSWPLLPEGREQDHNAYSTAISERQREALTTIHAQGGLEIVLSFIPHVKGPAALGHTLVQAKLENEEQSLALVTEYLKCDDEAKAAFGLGVAGALAASKAEAERIEWVEDTLQSHSALWSPIQQAEWLVRLTKPTPQIWKLVSQLAEAGQNHYWRTMPYFFVEEEDTEQGVRFFLQYQHPGKAAELLSGRLHDQKPISTDLATEVLEELLLKPAESYPSSHIVENVIEYLAEAPDADRVRVIRLEYNFLTVSYNYRSSLKPKLIYQELSDNPGLFVDLVTRLFRAEGEEPRVLTSEESDRSMGIWELLESWRTVPGTDREGNIDKDHLFAWVDQVREALRNGRQSSGDERVGQLLSGSPKGTDGIWPHEAVRAVFEKAASPDMEQGFIVGHYNSRGVTTRNPYEGGKQEYALAKEYYDYATAVEFSYPRTAEVLRWIAKDYEQRARREDIDASLSQDLNL